MYLHFDERQLMLVVNVAPTEEYKPGDQVKELNEKLTELREKLMKFQESEVHPVMEEIRKKVTEENEKYKIEPKQKVESKPE